MLSLTDTYFLRLGRDDWNNLDILFGKLQEILDSDCHSFAVFSYHSDRTPLFPALRFDLVSFPFLSLWFPVSLFLFLFGRREYGCDPVGFTYRCPLFAIFGFSFLSLFCVE